MTRLIDPARVALVALFFFLFVTASCVVPESPQLEDIPAEHAEFKNFGARSIFNNPDLRIVGYSFPPDEATWERKLYGPNLFLIPDLTGPSPYTDGPAMDNEHLALLAAFPDIQHLGLRYTNVDDTGLMQLRELRNLRYLDLGYTGVTDAGMAQLKGLTKLKELKLDHSKVTEEGIKVLQQSLPKCKIVVDTQMDTGH